jgi:hypothetical protein
MPVFREIGSLVNIIPKSTGSEAAGVGAGMSESKTARRRPSRLAQGIVDCSLPRATGHYQVLPIANAIPGRAL